MTDRTHLIEIWKAHAVQMRDVSDTRLDEDDGHWITTENGHKVHINGEGVPDKGNPHVISKMGGGVKGAAKAPLTKSPANPVKPNLKKCRGTIKDTLKLAGAESKPDVDVKHSGISASAVEVYSFGANQSTSDIGATVVNALREQGFDAVFMSGKGDQPDKPCGSIYVQDPNRDYRFIDIQIYKDKESSTSGSHVYKVQYKNCM